MSRPSIEQIRENVKQNSYTELVWNEGSFKEAAQHWPEAPLSANYSQIP